MAYKILTERGQSILRFFNKVDKHVTKTCLPCQIPKTEKSKETKGVLHKTPKKLTVMHFSWEKRAADVPQVHSSMAHALMA